MTVIETSRPLDQNLRIATWNVNGGRRGAQWWEFLRDSLHADVAIVQEATGAPGYGTWSRVERTFNVGKHGKAIYIVALNTNIAVENVQSLSGGAAVSFSIKDLGIRFIGVHALRNLSTGHTSDYLAARLCIDGFIKTITDLPTIIAGDFNQSVLLKDGKKAEVELGRLAKLSFRDMACEPTCNRLVGQCSEPHAVTRELSGVTCRIDYVLANTAALSRVRSMRTVVTADENCQSLRTLSDHNPIVFDISR